MNPYLIASSYRFLSLFTPAGTRITSSSRSSSLSSASAASSSSASSTRLYGIASSSLSRSHVHFVNLFAAKFVVAIAPCKEAIAHTLQPAAAYVATAVYAALAWVCSMWKQWVIEVVAM